MRAKILSVALVLGSAGLFSSCNIDLGQAVQEMSNMLSVDFSSASPAYTGPTIDGPNVAVSAAGVLFGSTTKDDLLRDYHLDVVFHVKADNSKNSGRASFGQTVRPVLNFRVNTKTSAPISTEMEPFSVDSGAVGSLDFKVSVSLKTLLDNGTLQSILNGTSIPYFLSGTLNFDLMEGISIKGTGASEIDLATGAIPTRPKDGIDLTKLANLLL